MKLALGLVFVTALVTGFTFNVTAQDNFGTAQTATDLRWQLLDVQAKEAELEAQARQLDEALKPENIEHSLAGIGSTKPEELRELRRRQLTIERERVGTQLKLVETSRERLESVIRTADAEAYQQSALGPSLPVSQTLRAGYATSPRWAVGTLAGFIAILGIVFVITVMRRLNR